MVGQVFTRALLANFGAMNSDKDKDNAPDKTGQNNCGASPYESKSRQLGGSSNSLIARILLRELAAEGKA
jgi:hypothetical protein